MTSVSTAVQQRADAASTATVLGGMVPEGRAEHRGRARHNGHGLQQVRAPDAAATSAVARAEDPVEQPQVVDPRIAPEPASRQHPGNATPPIPASGSPIPESVAQQDGR